MTNTNITNFRRNIFGMVEQTIKFNEPLSINTKAGTAVLLSEEDYRSMVETLFLSSNPKLKKEISDGLSEPLSEGVEYDPNEEW